MNLISELESDLATAFLIEKKHKEKINLREARSLIAEIREKLARRPAPENVSADKQPAERKLSAY